MSALVLALAWFFIIYVVALHLANIGLNLLAIAALYRQRLRAIENLPPPYRGFDPPVSLVVPAFDQADSIVASVSALLQLEYTELEIVVVNDGSRDATFEALRAAFELEPFPEAYWRRLQAQPVRAVYRSRRQPRLRVVDKEHGGVADALNVGINAARNPLVCAIDTSTVLQVDSLRRVVEPFMENPATVAIAGSVRIANGCRLSGDRLEPGLPRSPWALLQIAEHLRSGLFTRLGWARLNALLVVPEAFVMLRKDSVIEAGGYRSDARLPHLELLVRLHRMLRARGERYAVGAVPDAICWIAVPESAARLGAQRGAWQQALAETLGRHVSLAEPRGGTAGLLALPYFAGFECVGPLVELAGYALLALMWLAGFIPGTAFGAFVLLGFSLGFLASMTALALEEAAHPLYPRFSHAATLVAAAIVENAGYRQWLALVRAVALVRGLRAARP